MIRGKSFSMIMTASKNGAVIFCANKDSEKRVLAQAKEIGVTVNTMVSNK
mgnify:CR=1 FL=1